jgi:uncharacterized protein involved in response to NO
LTETDPPSRWQLSVAAAAPVFTVIAAWYERFALSQLAWLTLVAVLVGFALRRFAGRRAGKKPPDSFVWIPLSFAMGVAGSLLIGAYGLLGEEYFRLHEVGRLLLLQGMFVGLVVGLGGMVFPLVLHGERPAERPRRRGGRILQLAGALVLGGSFWIENALSLRGGLALRGLLVLVLLLAAGAARPPRMPGWHRRLIWLAGWMIPLGYLLAALYPAQKKAGLHVVFIAGFALLALSVGLHVTLAHGGDQRRLLGRPWQVPLYGGLLLLATANRALVDFDPSRFFDWMVAAAAAFLAGSLFWAAAALPRLISPAPAPLEEPAPPDGSAR